MDDVVDRELASALSVAPSPAYVARIRQRIAAEPPPRSFAMWWLPPLVGAAAVAAALTIALRAPSTMPGGPPPTAPLAARVIGWTGPASPAAPMGPAIHAAPRVRRSARQREPHVLIDAREANAIRTYLDGIRSGRIDRAVAAAARDDAAARPLGIDPIVIDPLMPAGPPEGVSR